MNKEVKLKPQDILSHLILEDHDTAMQIADTPEWDGGKGVLEMDIKVNGVAVDTEVFRKVMEHMRQQAADSVDESQYRERVEAKAREILKNQSDNVMDALYDLQNKITYTENLIKFEWEK